MPIARASPITRDATSAAAGVARASSRRITSQPPTHRTTPTATPRHHARTMIGSQRSSCARETTSASLAAYDDDAAGVETTSRITIGSPMPADGTTTTELVRAGAVSDHVASANARGAMTAAVTTGAARCAPSAPHRTAYLARADARGTIA